MKIVIFPKKNGNRIIGINVDTVENVDNFGRKNRIFCKNAEILIKPGAEKLIPDFRAEKISTSPEKNISPEFVDIVDSYF